MFINNFTGTVFPAGNNPMKTHDTELKRIKDLIRDNPKGMKITRIARTLGMNRNAAAKYLEILLMTGQVEVFEHGMSKIFILSRRTGIPTMLDGSSDLILVVDSEMKVSRVNDNYLRFAGMRQEDLIGKRADGSGLPVLSNPLIRDRIRQAQFGEDVRMEVEEAGAGGSAFFFDVRLTPTMFNDGTRGITVSISNITQERKMQEAAAEESRKLVEGILSCMDDAVILMDSRSGTISFLNPAARVMFGYGPFEYAGKPAGSLAGITGTIPLDSANLAVAFRQEGYFETDMHMKRHDGSEFPACLQFRPVYDTKGGIRNLVIVVRDLTVRSGDNLEVMRNAWDPACIPSAIFSSPRRRPNQAI
jgi:PAS domain S-box-containing protein